MLSSAIDEYRTAIADNLRHPVLRGLRQHHASLELPWQLWLCGTPHVADAIERLDGGTKQARGARAMSLMPAPRPARRLPPPPFA